MDVIRPMCPFCNRENTFVVRNRYNEWHCNNCGGDFKYNGDPIYIPEPEEAVDRCPQCGETEGISWGLRDSLCHSCGKVFR